MRHHGSHIGMDVHVVGHRGNNVSVIKYVGVDNHMIFAAPFVGLTDCNVVCFAKTEILITSYELNSLLLFEQFNTSISGSIIYQDKIFPLIEISNGEWTIPEANKDKVNSYLAILGSLAMADLGIHIWSCIDAVRIAKVKNQYFQDKRGKHAFSADIHPSVNMVQNGNGVTPTAGMTLAVRF